MSPAPPHRPGHRRPGSRSTPRRWLLLALALALAATSSGALPDTGEILLRVADASGGPLPGAVVSLPELDRRRTTDSRGVCRIRGVPAGLRRLEVSHLGYAATSVEVEVEAESLVRSTVTLRVLAFRDSVTVRDGLLEEGRARSLHRQRQADELVEIVASDQIGRFPDLDAAAAVQRLPGALALRDQGEPRIAVIRGLPPSYSSILVNGERVPSGEADERTVALDLVPTEILETIELAKTPTPDRDGDWVGGAVDLITRNPPRGRRVAASGGAGADEASDGPRTLATVVVGDRRGDDGAGFLVAASHLDVERGVDAFEQVFDDGEPDVVRFQDSTVDRRRRGLTAALDLPWGDGSLATLRGLWSELEDHELRRRRETRIAESVRARELKDRTEAQELLSLRAAGQHLVGGSLLLEARLAWNRAEENEPERFDTVFVEEEIDPGAELLPAPEIDPGDLSLEEIRREADFANVEGRSAAADLTWSLPRFEGTIAVGAKLRSEDVERDDNLWRWDGDEDLRLADFLDVGWRPAEPFEVGPAPPGLDLGPFPDPDRTGDLLALLDGEPERDLEEDLGDYRATEETRAVYGRLDLDLGPSLSLVGGVRWEETRTDYEAFELSTGDGDEPILSPTRGGGSWDEILPMAQLRWAPRDAHWVRASLSRTLVRPEIASLAPFRLVLEDEEEIELGNPGLRPTTSWNLDLAWERALDPLGRLSANLFVKDLDDVIVTTRSSEPSEDGEIVVLQPRNAGDAELLGLELAFEQRFRSLPAPLDGLGLQASWTWTDATTDLPARPDTELPGRARSFGQAALSFERAGFSARLAWTSRDRLLEELGAERGEDLWLEERHQVDLSIRQQMGPRWSLFLEALNLGDEPFRRSLGPEAFPVGEERFGRWALLGIRFDL